MKNYKKVVVTAGIVVIMAVIMCISSLAYTDVPTLLISLESDHKWTSSYEISRNLDYSYVGARCYKVYPLSGIDVYDKIRCELVDSDNDVLSNEYILDEDASDYTAVAIYQGYLSYPVVYIRFSGNSNFAAEAIVGYRGYALP